MSEASLSQDQNGVLDDIRRALGRSTSVAPAPLEPFTEPNIKSDAGELIARFTAEATAVRAHVYLMSDKLQFVAGDESASPQPIDKLKFVGQIVEICRSIGATNVALSNSGLIAEMNLEEQLGAQGLSIFALDSAAIDHEHAVAQLAQCEVGLTAVDYAIAETGTIVLSSDERHSLLISLLPPVHIALVRSSQIKASLDEIIKAVGAEKIARVDPSRSVTLITGPSRTSDVELVLSVGVHGPKELHVIVID